MHSQKLQFAITLLIKTNYANEHIFIYVLQFRLKQINIVDRKNTKECHRKEVFILITDNAHPCCLSFLKNL